MDTRADASAYTASGIPETLDQPTTVTQYYLHRRNAGSTVPSTKLLFLDNEYADPTNTKDFDIREYSIAEATTLLELGCKSMFLKLLVIKSHIQ